MRGARPVAALAVAALLAAGCGLAVSRPPPETPRPMPPPVPGDAGSGEPPGETGAPKEREGSKPPEAAPPESGVEMTVEPDDVVPEPPPPPGPGEAAAEALASRARAALAAGRTAEAISLLERALALSPNRAATYLDLARAYIAAGLAEQALGLVGRAELLVGGEEGLGSEGRRLKADCLLAAGREDEAEDVLRRAGAAGE